jgi:hypothetical protein
MSDEKQLTLEILGGPLDGVIIVLQENTDWRRSSDGPLTFPWDPELGDPQAHFALEADGWYLEGLEAPHGTYRVNREERVTGKKIRLEDSDILKASKVWLAVRRVE